MECIDQLVDDDDTANATVAAASNSQQGYLDRLRCHGMNAKESQPHHATLKRASVLVLLTEDGKILLTKRSSRLRSHPGQVCCPGGKRDPEDKDDLHTALRETLEEVGLDFFPSSTSGSNSSVLKPLESLCRLATLESINHLCVTPIVMKSPHTSLELSRSLVLNTDEVDSAFWVPMHFFQQTKPVEEYPIEWSGETFIYRKYLFHDLLQDKEFEITGLTAHIAHHLATIAFSDATTQATTMTTTTTTQQGYLWKFHEKNYWIQQYFVLTPGGILHQYDNEQQAIQKAQSANKKNRLRMDDSTQVFIAQPQKEQGATTSNKNDDKHIFDVQIMNGRIAWKLASATTKDRDEWTKHILSVIPATP